MTTASTATPSASTPPPDDAQAAIEQAKKIVAEAADKARELGQAKLADGLMALANGRQDAHAPAGPTVDRDRHELNQRVETYMQTHDCDIYTAVRALTGGDPPKGVDAERHEMNERVEAFMAAHPETDIHDAIRAVERSAA